MKGKCLMAFDLEKSKLVIDRIKKYKEIESDLLSRIKVLERMKQNREKELLEVDEEAKKLGSSLDTLEEDAEKELEKLVDNFSSYKESILKCRENLDEIEKTLNS